MLVKGCNIKIIMGEQITALWQEAEERLRTFGELARRTVEAAWLAVQPSETTQDACYICSGVQ